MRSASTTPAAVAGCAQGFRGVICVSFGKTDAPAEENTGGRPRRDLHFGSADPETLARLQSVLASACVGVRLVLAGPPADIHAAAATAAECGLLEEEIRLLSDGAGPLVVFCGHCHTATQTLAGVGSEMDCQGCAARLAVSGHFSRRIGGYLGFAAHAEEAA